MKLRIAIWFFLGIAGFVGGAVSFKKAEAVVEKRQPAVGGTMESDGQQGKIAAELIVMGDSPLRFRSDTITDVFSHYHQQDPQAARQSVLKIRRVDERVAGGAVSRSDRNAERLAQRIDWRDAPSFFATQIR